MQVKRLIARLDIKEPNLVKGVQLEGFRKLGDPNEKAKNYYLQGIDEIFYTDIVASLYERNSILDLISKTVSDVFVPITVGGGLRSIDDVAAALRAGADKVAINTAAIKNPKLLSEIANKFGSQCLVLSIQAKSHSNYWECFYDNGREHSHIDVLDWAKKAETLGVGEILVTSVDREGTGKGYDLELIEAVSKVVNVPVIAGGGMGAMQHLSDVFNCGADAAVMAKVLHYGEFSIPDIKNYCCNVGIPVRPFGK